MTKNAQGVSLKKSKRFTELNGVKIPNLPSADKLVEGELAINYAEGVETISTKNESGTVVTFSSDDYYTNKKLGSGFTGVNSAKTVTEAIEEIQPNVNADWDETDETSPSFIENKPFGEICGEYVIGFESTFTAVQVGSNDYGLDKFNFTGDAAWVEGDTYRVTINDDVYVRTCVRWVGGLGLNVDSGALSPYTDTWSINKFDTSCMFASKQIASGDTVHLKVEQLTCTIKKLDEKYIDTAWEKGSGDNSIKIKNGNNIANGSYSIAIGSGSTANGDGSIAMGSGATANSALSYAEGLMTYANGQGTHAEGCSTSATTNGMPGVHAEGLATLASNGAAHAEGQYTLASGQASHAEGNNTKASGQFSHTEGNSTTASGDSSHAEGNSSIVSGSSSHAEGQSTSATSFASHTEGLTTLASGGYGSHAEGYSTSATSMSSHAEGENTLASGRSSHAEGSSTSAMTNYSHAEGNQTKASGDYSHAEGESTIASGKSSHAEGESTSAMTSYSHAEGNATIASGYSSHAEGFKTISNGYSSHAEGSGTTASGESSHAEGFVTIASGKCSHAEGGSTSAMANYSHSEGYSTTASGMYSHAEGNGTTASSDSSHAEGYGTIASGKWSHAEGSGTTASGFMAHAEGYSTTASGYMAHVEGSGTTASGYMTHAEGNGTIAKNNSEHASGSFNISSSASTTFGNSGNTLFSVGNGTANDARHNAFEIRQNGDIYIVSKGGNDVKLQDEMESMSASITSHTASTSIHLTTTEKTNIDSLATNIAAISGITSTKVSNWNTAYTNNHTHSNKSALDSITGNVGTMAYQAASSYSSATQVNTALDGKSDISHNQGSNTISAMTNYSIASSASAIVTTDSLNAAIGKLEKRISLLEAALGSMKLVKLTQAEYDALTTKDSNTLYVISD